MSCLNNFVETRNSGKTSSRGVSTRIRKEQASSRIGVSPSAGGAARVRPHLSLQSKNGIWLLSKSLRYVGDGTTGSAQRRQPSHSEATLPSCRQLSQATCDMGH